jgi:hypothetical protein
MVLFKAKVPRWPDLKLSESGRPRDITPDACTLADYRKPWNPTFG